MATPKKTPEQKQQELLTKLAYKMLKEYWKYHKPTPQINFWENLKGSSDFWDMADCIRPVKSRLANLTFSAKNKDLARADFNAGVVEEYLFPILVQEGAAIEPFPKEMKETYTIIQEDETPQTFKRRLRKLQKDYYNSSTNVELLADKILSYISRYTTHDPMSKYFTGGLTRFWESFMGNFPNSTIQQEQVEEYLLKNKYLVKITSPELEALEYWYYRDKDETIEKLEARIKVEWPQMLKEEVASANRYKLQAKFDFSTYILMTNSTRIDIQALIPILRESPYTEEIIEEEYLTKSLLNKMDSKLSSAQIKTMMQQMAAEGSMYRSISSINKKAYCVIRNTEETEVDFKTRAKRDAKSMDKILFSQLVRKIERQQLAKSPTSKPSRRKIRQHLKEVVENSSIMEL